MEPKGSLPHSQASATCPYPGPAQSSPHTHIPTSWRSILILPTHLRLGVPSGLFPSGFPTKTLFTAHYACQYYSHKIQEHKKQLKHFHQLLCSTIRLSVYSIDVNLLLGLRKIFCEGTSRWVVGRHLLTYWTTASFYRRGQCNSIETLQSH